MIITPHPKRVATLPRERQINVSCWILFIALIVLIVIVHVIRIMSWPGRLAVTWRPCKGRLRTEQALGSAVTHHS